MLLYSNNKRIVIFTDHDSTNGIMKSINLNTISINRTNRRLTNTSVYLSAYLLDVCHIPSRFNLVPNVFSYLRTIRDDIVRIDNEAELAFDAIWNEDKKKEPNNVFLIREVHSAIKIDSFFLIESIIRINDFLRQRFILTYKKDNIYSKIILDLYLHSAKANEEILKASKFGHLFHLTDSLLYSKDNKHRERLVVPFSFV